MGEVFFIVVNNPRGNGLSNRSPLLNEPDQSIAELSGYEVLASRYLLPPCPRTPLVASKACVSKKVPYFSVLFDKKPLV